MRKKEMIFRFAPTLAVWAVDKLDLLRKGVAGYGED
jgi:hypothetical protein